MSSPQYGEIQEPDVCYRHPDRQTYIHCQRCDRPICPECQTPAPVGVLCPECMREGRESIAATRAGGVGTGGYLRRMLPQGVPVVTYVLMGVCVLVYVLQLVSGGAVTNAGVLNPSRIASEPWRLLTSAFLHSPGTILHLLFNLYALFIFGPALEHFLGRARYLALYLVGALGGSVGVVLVYELYIATGGASLHWLGTLLTPSSALGASGAIFALMGAMLAMRRQMGVQTVQLLIVVAINLAFGFFVAGIAWEAHLFGLITGFAIGSVLIATRRRSRMPAQIAGIAGIAVVLALICVACVATAPVGAYL
jgi:membrane associated rhomboid family serine protease